MQTEKLVMLTEDTAEYLIGALKVATMVNITWGEERGMLCGNPLAEPFQLLAVACSNKKQAWAINRAKEAMGNGDETRARAHLAPLIKKAVRH